MHRKYAITERLSTFQSWRYSARRRIERVQEVLSLHQFFSPESQNALDALSRRIEQERLTVVFVAEADRGKSELINALFFGDLGHSLLPSRMGFTTRCVTEIRFDADQKSSIRLLPIETRESPRRLHELVGLAHEWRVIGFEPGEPSSVAKALAALAETRRISLADAVSWGMHGAAARGDDSDAAARVGDADLQTVDVPRWRHAIINYPHPLLDAGLVILDVPGAAALGAEPELRRERLSAADAIITLFSIDAGVTKPELSMWKEHLGGGRNPRDRALAGTTQARLIALNHIDLLLPASVEGGADGDPESAAKNWLRDLNQRAQELADLLHVDARHVIPVSSTLALSGCFTGDGDALAKSRLYQLERELTNGLSDLRQKSLSRELSEALYGFIDGAQAALDHQRFQALENLQLLGELRTRNQHLMSAILAERMQRTAALAEGLSVIRTLKPIHLKLSDELALLVDAATIKRELAQARAAIAASIIPSVGNEALDGYFSLTFNRLTTLAAKIEGIRTTFGSAGETIFQILGLGRSEVHPFATQRFEAELTKIGEAARAAFAATSSLKLRRGINLATQFDSVVGERVVHMFAIAERESVTWMRGILSALERPLTEVRNRHEQRSERADKIASAELDLTGKITDLQAELDVIHRKHEALVGLREAQQRLEGEDDEAY